MEAIANVRVSEWPGSVIPAEEGTEEPAGLFAQVLARQTLSPGQGSKPKEDNPQEKGTTASQRGELRPWPVDANRGSDQEEKLLAEIPAVLLAPTVHLLSTVVSRPEQTLAQAARGEEGFDRGHTLSPLPGQGPAPVAEYVLPGSPDQNLKNPLETVQEPDGFAGPAGPQRPFCSVEKPAPPVLSAGSPRLKSTDQEPPPGAGKDFNEPIALEGYTPGRIPESGEQYPGEARKLFGKLSVSAEEAPTKIPPVPREAEMAETQDRIPLKVVTSRPEGEDQKPNGSRGLYAKLFGPAEDVQAQDPPAPKGPGLPETQNPIRSAGSGPHQAETVRSPETRWNIPDWKMDPAAFPDQTVTLDRWEQASPTTEKNVAAAEGRSLSLTAGAKAAVHQSQGLENIQQEGDPDKNPVGLEAAGRLTQPGPVAGVGKDGNGGKAIENPQPVTDGLFKISAAPGKTVSPGEADRGKAPSPADTGNRRSPIYVPDETSQALPADTLAGSESEKISPPGNPGTPSANAPLPVEALASGRSPVPEALPGEAAIKVPVKDPFPETIEEKKPVYQQLSRGLVQSLNRGEDKIQLTLDPPHLGTIFLELHRNRQSVEAQVWTDNPVTKGLLDTQQGQLHKALEQEGFRLDRFDVAFQQDLKSFSEERWAQGRQPAWEEPSGENTGNPAETARSKEPGENARRFQNGNQYIDTWI